MTAACTQCGKLLDTERFCPGCGTVRHVSQAAAEGADPFIGSVISDRYEVTDLINVGGMGRVYRATQRLLDRVVAIKFIHPQLLTTESVVSRFMSEARAASKLNHPNVVSIFDFGRTPKSEGAHLFLVMELLGGADLGSVLERTPHLPFVRIANILRQTLAALGEAHYLGITHRDIKPENIVLESTRRDGDLVKVIDFGIAKIGGERHVTQAGQLIGTPIYMSPEQSRGGIAGPSTDLYAVGVILFQLLTGKVPFDGANPTEILLQHIAAPRPDPRMVAPEREIPGELAEICLRAMDIDPANRFADAESFAEALVRATAAGRWSTRDASLFPRRNSMPGGHAVPPPGATGTAETVAAMQSVAQPDKSSKIVTTPAVASNASSAAVAPAPAVVQPSVSTPPVPASTAPVAQTTLPPSGRASGRRGTASMTRPDLSFVGREGELAWAESLLTDGDQPRGIVFWGRAGSGRSRLLHEVADRAGNHGWRSVRVAFAPPPRSLVGYSGLREMISEITGVESTKDVYAAARPSNDASLMNGLRAVFEPESVLLATDAMSTRQSVDAALVWAIRQQTGRAPRPTGLLVVLDDVDELDSATQAALAQLMLSDEPLGARFLMSSASGPDDSMGEKVAAREIRGLSHADAVVSMGDHQSLPPSAEQSNDVEPLFISQLLRWRTEAPREEAPWTLVDVIDARVRKLAPAQQRTLQVIALTGGGTIASLAAAMARPEDLDEALRPLEKLGFIEMCGDELVLAHAMFGFVALASAPAGAVEELHRRAADALSGARDQIELRAFHAVRGAPGFEAYLLMEEAVRLRMMRGDEAGAISALWDGLHAARAQVTRGEVETATGAWIVFGQKLGTALMSVGRADEAYGVLCETLDVTGAQDISRALVLEKLAMIARFRERPEEAERRRIEALAIAQRLGDSALIERLKAPTPRMATGPRSRVVVRATPAVGSASRAPATSVVRRGRGRSDPRAEVEQPSRRRDQR